MKEIIRQFVRLPGVLRHIGTLEYTADFKRGLRRTHLATAFCRRHGSAEMAADIAGYKMRYCHFGRFVHLFREIFLDGEYCFNTGGEKPYIIDCGSNIGLSILYFKVRFPGAEITAFEPDENAFSCLEENVSFNSLKGVALNKKAVSGREGSIDFWRSPDVAGALGNTILASPTKQRVTVSSVRLSDRMDRKVDFLKLDVEGAELEIIRDLAGTGKLSLVDQLYTEYHLHMEGEQELDVLSELLRLLESAGFGYQLSGELGRPYRGGQFQTLGIYAYNKKGGKTRQVVK